MIEINIKEWKFVGLMGIFITIITILPLLIGLSTTPLNSVFLGLQTINTQDTPVYYSWIEQIKGGHLLFKNLFTGEDHPRFIFDIFWLGVGLFAKFFSLSSFAAYQLARIFLIPIFLGVAYIFISYFLKEKIKRKICFIFLLFASGLGWLINLGTNFGFFNFWPPPMDVWVAEAVTFYTLYHSPHFIASLISILLIFLLILQAFEKQKLIYSFLAGITALIFFQFHPYYAPTILGVIGLYLIILSIRDQKIRWDLIKHYLILIFVSFPSILYHFWALNTFWIRQQQALQNNLVMPPFYNLLLTYGFLLILSLLGIIYLFQKKLMNDKNIFLLTWWGVQWLLPYAPFLNYQRKMLESFHVVMVILSIFGLFYLKETFKGKKFLRKYFLENKPVLILLFILLFTFSNFFIMVRDSNFYLTHHPLTYPMKEKLAAMTWLQQNTSEKSVILAEYANSNIIPAVALRPVYFGHWGMTADATGKMARAKWFFRTTDDKAKAAFLRTSQINYLFFGSEEGASGFNPEEKDYLEEVYQNEKVAIYKVIY